MNDDVDLAHPLPGDEDRQGVGQAQATLNVPREPLDGTWQGLGEREGTADDPNHPRWRERAIVDVLRYLEQQVVSLAGASSIAVEQLSIHDVLTQLQSGSFLVTLGHLL